MLRLRSHFVMAACLLLAVPIACFAQSTAVDQVSGTIQDSTGAFVAKATVKATQTDTGFTRTAISGSGGSYVLSNLPIGPYRIEVSAAGFKTTVQDGIVLQVNVNPAVNFTLQVGEVTQQVEVQATASMAETETAAIGQVINSQSVDDLPLNGRNPAQLVVLSGASVQINGYIGSKNYPTSETIAVAGGDTNGTEYLMDGGYHNDVFSAVNLPLPFPDILQEFSVQTSSIPASYGERAGGVVNVLTKSGTNAFHGDVFEFIRNGIINSKNYFATTVDKQKRNQFGVTGGGPIKRDKLFFFGGWQEEILRTAPPTTISFTPTQAELGGDFSAISKVIINPQTGLPFPGNQIPTSLFTQASLSTLKYIPVGAPLGGSLNGEVKYPIPSPLNENQYLGRIDWNQSARDTVFGRYYYTKASNPAQFGGNLLLTTAPGVIDTVQAVTAGDTFTLSASKFNSLHYAWTYERINRGPAAGVPSAASLGLQVAPSANNSPQISVSSYFTTMCGTCSVATVYSGANQLADDFTLLKGRQQIVFGVDWVGKYLHYVTSSAQNVSYSFTGQATASPCPAGSSCGSALADFMLGLADSFTLGSIEKWNPVMNYFGYYVSDTVKLNHRLSLTAGLRWEPYLPAHATDNKASHFDVGAFAQGTMTSQFVNAPPGILYPGDKGLPTGGIYHSLANLGPRVGLVWDVQGDAKTIVHVGYGVIDDGRNDLEAFDRYSFEPPYGNNLTLTNPAGGWANPFSAYPGGDPFPLPDPPTRSAPFVTAGVYINAPLHPRLTYFQEWNLSVQRQVGPNWLFTANYVGNQGTHTWSVYQADPAKYIPGSSTLANTNSRRLYNLINPTAGALISSMATVNDGGNSSYNAIILSANHRLKNNLSMLFNYTLAHCIDEADAFVEVTIQTQNPFNLGAERGNCGSDLRQIYNLSLVTGTPHWTGNALERIGADWHLSFILSGRSGFWFTPLTGSDASLTGVGADRPNVSGNPNAISHSLTKWFNTSLYSANGPGTYGDAGRNSILGPGAYEPDLAVYRDFPYELFHKNQLWNVRFESFAVTNHPQFGNPTATLSSGNFGKILSAQANPNNISRIMQLAVKYVF